MKKLLVLMLLVPSLSWAELTPQRGTTDPRVRVVDYNPAEVVRLDTFYGVSTNVQFGGEVITSVAVGDELAWTVVSRGSNLFIKPKAEKADTNITVVTDKHIYQFALIVQPRSVKDSTAWRDPHLIFSLSFRYPADEAAKAATSASANTLLVAQAAQAAEAASRVADVKGRLAAAKQEVRNTDYWAAGSAEVSPTGASDNGQFIRLTFSNNRDMPAVYAVDGEGNEALVNTHVDGNVIVVQRMVRRLTLRKGNAVVCVVNKSFDLDGGRDNNTGTVSNGVQRVIKGGQQ